jgi:hypothetical protein
MLSPGPEKRVDGLRTTLPETFAEFWSFTNACRGPCEFSFELAITIERHLHRV